VIRQGRCFCPKCGKKNNVKGYFGASQRCKCGAWLPQTELDRVRHYWIIQIALCYGIATFFFALALFLRDLPSDPWERFFSPILQGPAVAVFIASYCLLIWYKKRFDNDDAMFRYYLLAVSLLSISIVVTMLIARAFRFGCTALGSGRK
jgi:hypothetical protein